MIDFNRFTLSNGLRVIHNYDPTTAMVAVNVLYNVGSRDEDPSMTGLAHLFEHLMFGGSANIPDFDAEIERAGGMNNAWTSNDFTNFYDVAPARNFETLLWLESDRMLRLAFSEKSLEVQRNVVIEEFKQTHLNRPYGDLFHKLRSLVYRTHPYSIPTIGKEPAHIEKVTRDDVRDFFYSHYAPNNAVLAISGNVTPDQVRRGVERWFDSIPRRDIKPRTYQRNRFRMLHASLKSVAMSPRHVLSWPTPCPAMDSPAISNVTLSPIFSLQEGHRASTDAFSSEATFSPRPTHRLSEVKNPACSCSKAISKTPQRPQPAKQWNALCQKHPNCAIRLHGSTGCHTI